MNLHLSAWYGRKQMVRLVFFSIFMIYFQYFYSSNLGLFNTVPNLLLPVLIYYTLTKSNVTGLILGFLLGILLDINNPGAFGISTLLFVLIAFLLGEIKSKINPRLNRGEQKVFLLLFVLFVNLFYFFIREIIFLISNASLAMPILRILGLVLYNSFYSLIVIVILFFIDNLKISLKSFQ